MSNKNPILQEFDIGNFIINHTTDVIITFNPDYIIQFVNPTFESITLLNKDFVIGKHLEVVFGVKPTKKLISKISNGSPYRNILPCRGYNGFLHQFELDIMPYSPGEKTGFLMMGKDISRFIHQAETIKLMERELKTERENFETFLYRASHDLRGPIANIMGLIKMSKPEEQDDPELKEILNFLSKSSQELDTTLLQLLRLSVIYRQDIKKRKIKLKKLIEKVITRAKVRFYTQDINFEIIINDNSEIYTDQYYIRNILRELIDNAIRFRSKLPDYMIKNKSNTIRHNITIKGFEKNDSYIIEIEDTGIGITESLQNDIYNFMTTGEHRASGVGLGLFIVKKAIESLKASIKVESKENSGTRFIISLNGIKN